MVAKEACQLEYAVGCVLNEAGSGASSQRLTVNVTLVYLGVT